MVEQCCYNIVDNSIVGSTTAFTPVDNLQQVVRFYACIKDRSESYGSELQK